MGRIAFVRHRSVSQLRYRYVSCRHPVEKPRWHALWLLARTDEPRTPAQAADLVGLSAVTVRAALHRWNDLGPEGVTSKDPEQALQQFVSQSPWDEQKVLARY